MRILAVRLIGVFLICTCFNASAARFFRPSYPTTDEKVEINVSHVAGNVHMLKQRGWFGGNIGVFVGEDGIFLVDDQFAPFNKKIMTAIRSISDKKIRFLINTHHHVDHVHGNENFANMGVLIIAHDKVRQYMAEGVVDTIFGLETLDYPQIAQPIITFNDRVSFHLNGERVNVIHLPPAHTDNDVIVHFTGSDVLHAGDVFRPLDYPLVDIGYGGTLDGIINAHNVLIELSGPNTKIIPGHGYITDQKLVIEARDMIVTLRDRIKKLVEEGKSLEEVMAADPTAEFDERWDPPYDVVGREGFIERYYRELKGDFQRQ